MKQIRISYTIDTTDKIKNREAVEKLKKAISDLIEKTLQLKKCSNEKINVKIREE